MRFAGIMLYVVGVLFVLELLFLLFLGVAARHLLIEGRKLMAIAIIITLTAGGLAALIHANRPVSGRVEKTASQLANYILDGDATGTAQGYLLETVDKPGVDQDVYRYCFVDEASGKILKASGRADASDVFINDQMQPSVTVYETHWVCPLTGKDAGVGLYRIFYIPSEDAIIADTDGR